jgi:NADPH2:quinone reductase
LAKLAGVPANQIFGTCSAKSMAAAREFGIRAFDYNTENWSRLVLEATGGEGVDIVLDPVLLGHYWSDGMTCLRPGGKYVAYGVTNSSSPGSLPLAQVICSFIRLSCQKCCCHYCDDKDAEFYNVGDERDRRPDLFAQDLRLLVDLVAAGTLRPFVGRVWKFNETQAALQSIASNSHSGKQIIVVDQ